MDDTVEVLFCELCNASVPLQDVERGTAVRLAGKTVGACCLAKLPPAAPPAGAVGPTGTSTGQANAAEGRLLPIGFILLAAIAAATIFLDRRFTDLANRTEDSLGNLDKSVKSHEKALADLERDVGAAATAAQLKAMDDRIAVASGGSHEAAEAQKAIQAQIDAQKLVLDGVQARLVELRDSRADYRPQFEQLQAQLQQQAALLAELKAQPRANPSEAAMVEPQKPPPAPVAPGLPPELARHVGKLADADPATRFEAVDELLRSKNPLVRTHLLPLATKDADTFVRRLVVEGLRDFKHAETVEALLQALGDNEEIVAETAWRSLKELTGQKLPFEAGGSKEAKQRAQQRWREWWDKNKATFG